MDDETIVRDSLGGWFRQDGHRSTSRRARRRLCASSAQSRYDIALLDIKMPGMDGLELQARLAAADPDADHHPHDRLRLGRDRGQGHEERGLRLHRQALRPRRPLAAVKRAAEHRSLRAENLRLKKSLESGRHPSAAARQPRRPCSGWSSWWPTVAASDATVLITGESGTGKELVARAIHAGSSRRYSPLVVVNCGALAEGILESELFGHEAGRLHRRAGPAQGQVRGGRGRHGLPRRDRRGEPQGAGGAAARARGEDGHAPRRQRRPCRWTSGSIAATNRDLQALVKAGAFREDLYWRLNVFAIEIPPLRERPEDIPLLAAHFLARFAAGHEPASRCASRRPRWRPSLAYPWPGNVRELQNAIERAVVVGAGPCVEPRDLPLHVTKRSTGAGAGLARGGGEGPCPVRARGERLEHHAGGPRPRRGPRRRSTARSGSTSSKSQPMSSSDGPARVDAVHLLPLGPLSLVLLEDLASRLSRRLAVPCRVASSPLEAELPRLPDRDQIDADALLSRLEHRATDPEAVVVGVTALDLAIPVFTFVFGRARQGGRAALVSLARLDPGFYGSSPDGERKAERTVTEMLHELGHLASLSHCEDAACLMAFAGSVERVDVRGSVFCDLCRGRLPRWLREPGRTAAG